MTTTRLSPGDSNPLRVTNAINKNADEHDALAQSVAYLQAELDALEAEVAEPVEPGDLGDELQAEFDRLNEVARNQLAGAERIRDKVQALAAMLGKLTEITWQDKVETRTQLQAVVETAEANAIATAEESLAAFAGPYASLAAYNLAVTAAYESYADGAASTAQTNAEATASTALTAFASGYASLAAYNTTVTAAYQGYANGAASTAQSNAIASAANSLTTFASGYASLAAYNTAVTAAYQGYADDAEADAIAASEATLDAFASGFDDLADLEATLEGYADTVADAAQAAAEATASSALTTFASGYASIAAYNTAVTSAYQTYANNAASTAQTNAIASAASSLTTFASGYASLAAYNTVVSSTYVTSSHLTTNYATASTIAGTYATQANAYAFQTMELDVNDYVTGLYSVNDGASGSITFRVDKLFAASSGGSPTAFLETGTNQSGATTIVMKADRFVQAGVDTGAIASNAVTRIWTNTGSPITGPITTGTTLVSVNCNSLVTGNIVVLFEADVNINKTNGNDGDKITVEIHDGVTQLCTREFKNFKIGNDARIRYPLIINRGLTAATGNRTISAKVSQSNFSDAQNTFAQTSASITVIEYKR